MKKVHDEDDEDEWDRDAATPKQLKFLKRLGVSHPEGISLDEASDLIDHCLKQREMRSTNFLLLGVLFAVIAIIIFLVFYATTLN